jgi:hypothetical protein
MPKLVFRNGEISVYEVDGQPGVLDHIDYRSPMFDRAAQALTGLKTIRDSAGSLTAAQLSDAVRLLASVEIALGRVFLGRPEVD